MGRLPPSNGGNSRSAEPYRGAVRHRIGDPRLSGRRTAGGQKSQNGTTDAVAVRLDTATDGHAVASLRYSEGVRIPAETILTVVFMFPVARRVMYCWKMADSCMSPAAVQPRTPRLYAGVKSRWFSGELFLQAAIADFFLVSDCQDHYHPTVCI